jgi:D-alanyl-lipoteichoic acid acyltransferase DltB (MBOAT superfamily)
MENLIRYLIFLVMSILAYWFLLPSKWRPPFLLAISLLFIALFNVQYIPYFLIHIGLVYIAGLYIEKGGRKKHLLILILVWLIGNLCFFKYGELLFRAIVEFGSPFFPTPKGKLPTLLLPLGISYIIFRCIHYIVEVYRKKAPRGSFIHFALYVLFFPTFLAGPVERFQRFHTQTLGIKGPDLSNVNQGLFRILLGVAKKFVLADHLARWIIPALQSPESYPRLIVLLFIYGTAIQVYLDFSGYTDMALGVARLFGYQIMENFNRPFFQRNIGLFWRNWHISVYSWIRDYFFFPFFGYRASTLKIYLGIFLTMVVFMLWHKGSLNFLILGIYNGLGLVLWQFFQEIKRRFPAVRRWVAKPFFNPVMVFLTFNFVSFGFLVFFFDLSHVYKIFIQLF